MTGTPWASCARTNAHGEHQFLTPTALGEVEARCPGVTADRVLPMPSFWRSLIGVRKSAVAPPVSPGGRHLEAGSHAELFAYPLDFAPRHCAGLSCLHDHAGASTPLPAMAALPGFDRTFAATPDCVHPADDTSCTERAEVAS